LLELMYLPMSREVLLSLLELPLLCIETESKVEQYPRARLQRVNGHHQEACNVGLKGIRCESTGS
jgi:hypothetical protein